MSGCSVPLFSIYSHGCSADELRESSGTRGLLVQQRWRRAIDSQTQSIPPSRIATDVSGTRGVVGFAGCASAESGDVVNRLLVAARRDNDNPRVKLGSQSEQALTRGYKLSPASRLSDLRN
jgi:hypothetical protein